MNFGLLLTCRFLVFDRDRRRIRRSFSYYVAPELLGQIEVGGHRLELGGSEREVTVLFSDIRDFTPLSETLAPQELVALLNELFTGLGGEILIWPGTIDTFIGEAIMAFWNARRTGCFQGLAADGVGDRLAMLPAGNGVERRLRTLGALRRGGRCADGDELAQCRELGAQIEPGLERLYATMPDRMEDFEPLAM